MYIVAVVVLILLVRKGKLARHSKSNFRRAIFYVFPFHWWRRRQFYSRKWKGGKLDLEKGVFNVFSLACATVCVKDAQENKPTSYKMITRGI